MLNFEFPRDVQDKIDAGKFMLVVTKQGPIGIVRDKETNEFVARAIGAKLEDTPLSPLITPLQFLIKGVHTLDSHINLPETQQKFDAAKTGVKIVQQGLGVVQATNVAGIATQGAGMVQNHMGFQETYRQIAVVKAGLAALQTSVGVLQATTALIGVGTVATIALSAINLQQTLKLREDVKQMRLEVKNGFIDLKQALRDQGAEIRQVIEQVAQDIKFEQHRVVLVQAYGLFTQALQRFRSAMQIQDDSRRNAEIDAVRGMLYQALASYTNPQLLGETCAAGQLRRLECAWAIEQAIVTTYQLQNEMSAVSDRLYHLKNHICENASTIINSCTSKDELNFLFPEMSRIRNHDLAVVETWQNQIDWMRNLSTSELELLNSSDFNSSETEEITSTSTSLSVPPEQVIYENLSEKSHYYSLRDQLRFMFQPDLRRDYENYINLQAKAAGYKILVTDNLEQASDLTVANLYYYFNIRDESNVEDELLEAVAV
ncbi:hypothetical protein [Calothrix sp. CCY 0018]|uniref:hypothetical protein n=1 Tax=Calothrix sp. CCY 0018 TaxID=3103864 RepID=UPI0039C5F37B